MAEQQQNDETSRDKLFRELNVHPHQTIRDKVFDHNVDYEFIYHHLQETQGRVAMQDNCYDLKLLNTWRLGGMNDEYPENSNKINLLLMYGLDRKEVYPILQHGLKTKRASKKCVFGEKGYYFASCSKKAANQAIPPNNVREKGADQSENKPTMEQVIYILFCEVAMGKMGVLDQQMKRGLQQTGGHNNSLVRPGLYTLNELATLKMPGSSNPENRASSYELGILRGPLVRNHNVTRDSNVSTNHFDYDEFYVEDAKRIRPYILAQVQCKPTLGRN